MKAVLLLSALISSTAFAQVAKIKLDGKDVMFDAPPTMRGDVLMVPVRNLVEAMGGTLRWDIAKETVSIWRANYRIDFTIGNRQASVDRTLKTMEQAAYIDKGRLFVPFKFVSAGMGYSISKEAGYLVLTPALKKLK